MKYTNQEIDEMVNKILSEEIEDRSEKLSDEFSQIDSDKDEDACRYHMEKFGPENERTKKFCEKTSLEENKKLSKKQEKYLDVAEPKGVLNKKDFTKLGKMKKKQVDEFFHDMEDFGDYHGDDSAENEAEKLSQNEPTYVGMGLKDNKMGKKFGSFGGDEWYMDDDRPFSRGFDFNYDEEEFHDFEPFYKKHGKDTRWFAPGKEGKRFFDLYKEKSGGPFIVRTRKVDDSENLDEVIYEIEVDVDDEFSEGNAFTDMLRKTKKGGKFKLGNKEYTDTSNLDESEKWIQKTHMKKNALKKKLGIPEDEKIPQNLLSKLKKELTSKAEGDKKLSSSDSKLLKQVNLAQTLKGIKEGENSFTMTENELVDMIENLVREEKMSEKNKIVGKNKNNIENKMSTGLKKTEKILGKNKKEGDNYFKDLTKKLTDYLKKGSKAGYEMNPEDFPQQNGQLDKKMKKKAYKASNAVEEYVENFAYAGGMENLHYDEIKPNEEWINDNIEGSSRTGNNPKWANAVETDLGKRIVKKKDANLFDVEKRQNSYKRVKQPVDTAGEHDGEKSIDNMFTKLESVEQKSKMKLNEDMEKIKNLITYDRKTQ